MLTSDTARVGRLTVSLRPAIEAHDYDYIAQRLADPGLLASAVAVCVFRAPLVAVPMGGIRRGRYLSVAEFWRAAEARSLLADRPGFPDVRMCRSPYRDACHTVEWAAPAPPWWDDDEMVGRSYGYSQAAIPAYCRRRAPAGHDPPAP
ncbi:DUF6302 family protein [Streptomyces xanthochromogenes]|uniref:Uncharacterized protein n=1 Tax=Streptomyces xanthochromogenes TaxID=67384 RepID=A0ABQ3AQW1_9ACTN|nr:DUF6302 family protein [Streptomyces xanthochromogenes]GGY61241.1 hypothetical protein GCM10010326_65050 [Streptomyces xanthochromogenes]